MPFSIAAVDAHAGGQVGRVVIGGVGELDVRGDTMEDRRRYFQKHHDWFRGFMLFEPRGYPQSCVSVVVPPADDSADVGAIIIEPQPEYPAMSGTNTMCIVTVLLETGALPMSEPTTDITLDLPGGPVRVRATCRNGRVTEVRFRGLPSFAAQLDAALDVPGLGVIEADLCFGGMSYVMVDAAALGLILEPERAGEVRDMGRRIALAARDQLEFRHPTADGLDLVEGTVLYAPPASPENDLRMTAVLTTGMIDRTPCGTGLAALLAARNTRGDLGLNEPLKAEGMAGAVWEGTVREVRDVGGRRTVVPEIAGQAWIYAYARYVLMDDDPFPTGFRMGDLWQLEPATTGAPSFRPPRRQA